MLKSFWEVEACVLQREIRKRVVLAGAHDEPALKAVVNAKRKGVITATLVGKADVIVSMLKDFGEDPVDYIIINAEEEAEAASAAVAIVKAGEGDIPMKGIMQTSTFARALLNKETGLVPAGNLLSLAAVFEHPDEERFVMFTDCAINIAPSAEDKKKILRNTARFAKALGMEKPKAAIISAVEKVTPKMQSTVDAQLIAEEGVEGFIVEGPLAFDGAISKGAAEHKGIESLVAGNADILVLPNICTGNVLYKTLTYVAKKTVATSVCGASVPVIITSRADTPETKYHSILLAILQCE